MVSVRIRISAPNLLIVVFFTVIPTLLSKIQLLISIKLSLFFSQPKEKAMSADNGIFILQSPNILSGTTEYRVAYAGAIENIDYFEPGSQEFFAMEVLIFGHSPIHTNEAFALKEAQEIEEQIGGTEYGVCFIPPRMYPFSNMSEKEAKEVLKPFSS